MDPVGRSVASALLDIAYPSRSLVLLILYSLFHLGPNACPWCILEYLLCITLV